MLGGVLSGRNSIEETIKQLKLMLKVRKGQKEIIECAGGSCINCNPDIKALTESIDILSDYKKIKEEFKAVDNECSRLERKEVEMEKIIDLIIKDLYKQAHISTRCYLQISIEECMKNKNCIECLKQYFINNAKEVK